MVDTAGERSVASVLMETTEWASYGQHVDHIVLTELAGQLHDALMAQLYARCQDITGHGYELA